MDTITVTLPRGLPLQNEWQRVAHLRPIYGWDELFLCEQADSLLPASRITALLARTVMQLGEIKPVTSEHISALTIGDREALLLHLRRISLGEKISCVLCCPQSACKERMDVEFNIHQLLLPPYTCTQTMHEEEVTAAGKTYLVEFRLPTGRDQEMAALLALEDLSAATRLLLTRCVQRVVCKGGNNGEDIVREWPLALAKRLPTLMAKLDPQAEVGLNLICPACGNAFTIIFDTAAYFFKEIATKYKTLYREAHLLAFHYHWREADIMAMTGYRRHHYASLLIDLASKGKVK